MTNSADDELTISPVLAAEAPVSFGRIFGNGQTVLAARRGNKIIGYISLQIRPGRVAALFPPAIGDAEPAEIAVKLINSAIDRAAAAGVRLIQTLLATDSALEAGWLERAGFKYAGDLLHLQCACDESHTRELPVALEYQPVDDLPQEMIRLGSIVERTYQNSKDCAVAQGVLSAGDSLADYRASGHFDLSRWFVVRENSREIGCLLLREHAASADALESSLHVAATSPLHPLTHSPALPHSPIRTQNSRLNRAWELQYMGVIHEFRGRGHGISIVRYAQRLAAQNSVDSMFLGVAAQNSPAIAIYSAAGFRELDRRRIYLRICG